MSTINSFRPVPPQGEVGPQRPFVGPVLPQAQSTASSQADIISLSAEAQAANSSPLRLMQFGGDRKHAIETLIASGARAENPKLPWYKDVLRAFAGGKTKTRSTSISPTQKINAKVKVKDFSLKRLRLSTLDHVHGRTSVRRHIDFSTQAPTGHPGQVKDTGQILGRGTVLRELEQNYRKPGGTNGGEPGTLNNSYFDPATGKEFLHTSEIAPKFGTDKDGTIKSKRSADTYRQIDLLNPDGQVNQRYIFDYAKRDVRLETVNDAGKVTSTSELSKKTDYWDLVDRLSMNPPSTAQA